ncbi:hypothetical protein TNCV_4723331 [Trichonephila clavipes]|uniref:Uncharacterized protein n=1 Tax=Trichonephila clavipes TaxID=2585209 RepID=A0A8X7BF81_TRICX|nr:hypothetical protein TNCV_4723331 [Trichonephila clavipes]
MSLISKPSCQILSKALAMSRKKYTRGLVLGKATVNQLRYSEQLMNCAPGSKVVERRGLPVSCLAPPTSRPCWLCLLLLPGPSPFWVPSHIGFRPSFAIHSEQKLSL